MPIAGGEPSPDMTVLLLLSCDHGLQISTVNLQPLFDCNVAQIRQRATAALFMSSWRVFYITIATPFAEGVLGLTLLNLLGVAPRK